MVVVVIYSGLNYIIKVCVNKLSVAWPLAALQCHKIIREFLRHLAELALTTHQKRWARSERIVQKPHITGWQPQSLMGEDGLGFNQAAARMWCQWGIGREAVLIAQTFTVNPATVIFPHTGEASLIRTISHGVESVVKGTCLTSLAGIFQKWSQKDVPLIFWTQTEPFSNSQICLLSDGFT